MPGLTQDRDLLGPIAAQIEPHMPKILKLAERNPGLVEEFKVEYPLSKDFGSVIFRLRQGRRSARKGLILFDEDFKVKGLNFRANDYELSLTKQGPGQIVNKNGDLVQGFGQKWDNNGSLRDLVAFLSNRRGIVQYSREPGRGTEPWARTVRGRYPVDEALLNLLPPSIADAETFRGWGIAREVDPETIVADLTSKTRINRFLAVVKDS